MTEQRVETRIDSAPGNGEERDPRRSGFDESSDGATRRDRDRADDSDADERCSAGPVEQL